MENNEVLELEEMKLEPFTLIHDVLINWWVILLGAIGAALLASVIVSVRYEPQYTTSATFAVASREDSNAYNNWSATYEMAGTLESILKSNSMRKIICKELDVKSMDAQISTEILGQTNLLILRVTADTSKEASDVIRVVMDNYTKVSYYALGNAVMDVLEEPQVPMYPDNPLNVRDAAKKAFVLMGGLLVFLFAVISYLRDTVKREQDIEKKLDARSLGSIPYERKYKTIREALKRKKSAILVTDPVAGFGFVEGYKKLATKIEYQMKKYNEKAIVVTSVSENEGKSTVAANLAISLAEQSKSVILIEGDLRRPSQFLIFNKDPEEHQEVGEYLDGNTRMKDVIVKSGVPNLYVALGKNCYSSSTEKVSSKRMLNLITKCKTLADYVIIDSPPAGLLGDAEVIAQSAGTVLVVAKQNYMLAEDINDVLDTFRMHHSTVLGVVLNSVVTYAEFSGNSTYYGKYGKYAKYTRNRGNE